MNGPIQCPLHHPQGGGGASWSMSESSTGEAGGRAARAEAAPRAHDAHKAMGADVAASPHLPRLDCRAGEGLASLLSGSGSGRGLATPVGSLSRFHDPKAWVPLDVQKKWDRLAPHASFLIAPIALRCFHPEGCPPAFAVVADPNFSSLPKIRSSLRTTTMTRTSESLKAESACG